MPKPMRSGSWCRPGLRSWRPTAGSWVIPTSRPTACSRSRITRTGPKSSRRARPDSGSPADTARRWTSTCCMSRCLSGTRRRQASAKSASRFHWLRFAISSRPCGAQHSSPPPQVSCRRCCLPGERPRSSVAGFGQSPTSPDVTPRATFPGRRATTAATRLAPSHGRSTARSGRSAAGPTSWPRIERAWRRFSAAWPRESWSSTPKDRCSWRMPRRATCCGCTRAPKDGTISRSCATRTSPHK